MTLDGLKLIFLTGETVSEKTLKAVVDLVRKGATCVLPPRLAPKDSDFNTIQTNTLVPDAAGQWLVVPEFYSLHYETFCAGPMNPLLRETLAPLIGDGDTLVYDFGCYQINIRQDGWDYPRHEIMTWNVPLTQAGTNPDLIEIEVVEK